MEISISSSRLPNAIIVFILYFARFSKSSACNMTENATGQRQLDEIWHQIHNPNIVVIFAWFMILTISRYSDLNKKQYSVAHSQVIQHSLDTKHWTMSFLLCFFQSMGSKYKEAIPGLSSLLCSSLRIFMDALCNCGGDNKSNSNSRHGLDQCDQNHNWKGW